MGDPECGRARPPSRHVLRLHNTRIDASSYILGEDGPSGPGGAKRLSGRRFQDLGEGTGDVMDDARIVWEQANRQGILIDEVKERWWAGRVFDVLEIDGGEAGLLVATETGGVWSISPNAQALPLSDTWNTPDTNCLAAGPDGPRHFFAGCDGGVIFETDASHPTPLLAWEPVDTPLPADAGDVYDVAVLAAPRVLVAACAGGLYWAKIPQPLPWWCIFTKPSSQGGKRSPYNWVKADAEDVGQTGYFSVAFGSTQTTEAERSRGLAGATVIAGATSKGVLVGRWSAGILRLQRPKVVSAPLGGGDVSDIAFALTGGPTSVATCDLVPRHAYAVCATGDGRMQMILRSQDGGLTWEPTAYEADQPGKPDVRTLAGDQGAGVAPNNCIAVHPTAPGVVAIGWQTGAFVSPQGGNLWIPIDPGVHHSDWHCLLFKPTTPDNRHLLYLGSDGGLAQISTDELFQHLPLVARSDYNRNLANLQFYSTWATRQFAGTMSPAPDGFGMFTAGVHDNGNIYCDLAAGPGPWKQLQGCDGGWTGIMADGGAIAGNLCSGLSQAIRGAKAVGGGFQDAGVLPVTQPPPADPAGILAWAADVVRQPRFRNARGELMVAGGGGGGQVYGAFAASSPGNYHFERLGVVAPPLPIGAGASFSGATIILGGTDGRSVAFDSRTGGHTELALQLPIPAAGTPQTGGAFARITMLDERTGFAILNATSAGKNYTLRLDALRWIVPASVGLPLDEPFYGLDGIKLRGRSLIFAATDDRVYMSEDGGETWVRASLSLPRRPHCAELRVGKLGHQTWLYLGTFGRSLWKANLSHLVG